MAGPEQADLLAKSRLVPKGPDTSALAMKKVAINAAIFVGAVVIRRV